MWTRSMSTSVRDIVSKNQIEKLANANIFRLKLTDGDYATVEYAKEGNEYDLIHTNVPDKYQGHGIGTLFAEFRHIAKIQQFMLKLNGQWGRIKYRCEDGVLDLYETEIPYAYRGKGYSCILAQKTFDYIAANKWRMKLSCDFLKDYYEKNKYKYQEFVIAHKLKYQS